MEETDLIAEDSKAPPVHGSAVLSPGEDLRREVIHSPNQTPAPPTLSHAHHVGKTEVRELDVTLRVDQNVLQLEVSVHNAEAVEVLQ